MALLCAGGVVYANHEPPTPPPSEPASEEVPFQAPDEVIVIVDELPREAASEENVTREELKLRPRRTPGQLLMNAPGLFVGQHAGGGKADQIFLRGFDADHGTDVAVFVDGVPVNQVSHAHGQGYADLHFVIPETIHHIHVAKGPYAVDAGDFATAGAVRLQTMRRLDEQFLTAGAGSFGTLRLVGGIGGTHEATDAWIAGELYASDGPFDHEQNLRRHNVTTKATLAASDRTDVWLEATSYGGGWDASGQVPLREVEAGRLSRFGSIDPSEGGLSARLSAVGGLLTRSADGRQDLELRAYATRYRLDLFSNFTFALDDPENGDGIEQVDHRATYGLTAESHLRRELAGLDLAFRFGADTRAHDADVALWHQRQRQRLDVKNAARVEQQSQGTWAEAAIGRADAWHVAVGGRADLFSWQVDEARGTAMNGAVRRAIANPKARADVRAARFGLVNLDLFANFGGGFHSNDARNVVAAGAGAPTLPRAWGGELGARVRERTGRFELSLAGWGLLLENELVWVGDAGEIDVRGESRRVGVEAAVRWRILSWLGADVEATVTRARFADGGRIPLAPALTVVGGLSARHPSGVAGQVRVRHLGDRPANEDDSLTAEGHTVVDLVAEYRWSHLELELAVDNLTDTEWREAQFAFESRLPGEAAPVEDLHFTPGVPLSMRASLTYTF